jgi:hypothetical protein
MNPIEEIRQAFSKANKSFRFKKGEEDGQVILAFQKKDFDVIEKVLALDSSEFFQVSKEKPTLLFSNLRLDYHEDGTVWIISRTKEALDEDTAKIISCIFHAEPGHLEKNKRNFLISGGTVEQLENKPGVINIVTKAKEE